MSLRMDEIDVARIELSELAYKTANAILRINKLDSEACQYPRDWTATFLEMVEAAKLMRTAQPAERIKVDGEEEEELDD